MNKSFATLDEAKNYAEGLVRAQLSVQESRVYADYFESYKKKHKKDRSLVLLGVAAKAQNFCEKMMPGGTWNVEVEVPGTPYEKYSMFGFREVKTQYHRFSAWYSRYLPYAYGMMKAEHSFRCAGIDFESVNSYYGTVYGFASIAGSNTDTWDRIDPADADLYEEVSSASYEVCRPDLPFGEMYHRALVFMALHKPHLVVQHLQHSHEDIWKRVCATIEYMGRPVPPKSKRPAKAA